jgi:hypothetical protein
MLDVINHMFITCPLQITRRQCVLKGLFGGWLQIKQGCVLKCQVPVCLFCGFQHRHVDIKHAYVYTFGWCAATHVHIHIYLGKANGHAIAHGNLVHIHYWPLSMHNLCTMFIRMTFGISKAWSDQWDPPAAVIFKIHICFL